MEDKITQSEVLEVWQEIISTANNDDPEYSFRLFDEIYRISKQKGGKR